MNAEDLTLNADRGRLYASKESLRRVTMRPDEIQFHQSNCHARNFLDCVKTRAKTLNPIEGALRSDTISHLSDIVVRTGRKITWDPKKEKIIGDPDASRMLSRPIRQSWQV